MMKKLGMASLLALFLLLGSACNQYVSPVPEESETYVHSEEELAEEMSHAITLEDAKVLSKLELANGNALHFIDEGVDAAAHIGVVEVTQPGNAATLPSLVTGERWTALELFQSLSAEQAPEQLVSNHRAAARASAEIPLEPRQVTKGLSPQATDVSYCFDLPYDLHYAARSTAYGAFGSVPPNHAHAHNKTSTHYLTTGVSAQRVLATCNATGYVKSVKVYYKSILFAPSPLPFPVNQWRQLDLGFEWLFPGQSMIYYSSSPYTFFNRRYRMRVGFTASGLSFNKAHSEMLW